MFQSRTSGPFPSGTRNERLVMVTRTVLSVTIQKPNEVAMRYPGHDCQPYEHLHVWRQSKQESTDRASRKHTSVLRGAIIRVPVEPPFVPLRPTDESSKPPKQPRNQKCDECKTDVFHGGFFLLLLFENHERTRCTVMPSSAAISLAKFTCIRASRRSMTMRASREPRTNRLARVLRRRPRRHVRLPFSWLPQGA